MLLGLRVADRGRRRNVQRRDAGLLGRRDADQSSESCSGKTLVGCLAAGLRIVDADEMYRGETSGCLVAEMQIGLRRVVQERRWQAAWPPEVRIVWTGRGRECRRAQTLAPELSLPASASRATCAASRSACDSPLPIPPFRLTYRGTQTQTQRMRSQGVAPRGGTRPRGCGRAAAGAG